MIGIEANDRVLIQASFFQAGDDLPHRIVDHRQHAGGQRHRLLQLPLARHGRGLGGELLGAALPCLVDEAHRRRRIVVRLIGQIEREMLWLVQVPILARRVEGMMRVREGDEGEKRIGFTLAALQILDRALFNEGGGVERFRHRRAVGLRTGVVMRQLVGLVVQCLPVRRALLEPLPVVAATLVAMLGHHVDVLVAVVGRLELVPVLILIAPGLLLLVIAAVVAPGLGDGAGFRRVGVEGREGGHRLQVALADSGGVIAAGCQHIDKRVGAGGYRPVMKVARFGMQTGLVA